MHYMNGNDEKLNICEITRKIITSRKEKYNIPKSSFIMKNTVYLIPCKFKEE